MQALHSATKMASVAFCLIIAGCSSSPSQWSDAAQAQKTQTGVAVAPSDLGVPKTPSVEYIRVKTEKSIFLDPPEGNSEVYLRVGDNSGRDWVGVPIRDLVAQELSKRGFTVVTNAKTASFSLQVNILLADEISAAEIAKVDETKYGQDLTSVVTSVAVGAVAGGLLGGAVGAGSGDVLLGAVSGGILGGALNVLSGSRKKDLLLAQQATKYFSIIMDVEVRERAIGTVTRSGTTKIVKSQDSSTGDVVADTQVGGSQGIDSAETESYTEESTWKRHRTRVIGKAKGKLVVFQDVEKDFAIKMVRAVAGFF